MWYRGINVEAQIGEIAKVTSGANPNKNHFTRNSKTR